MQDSSMSYQLSSSAPSDDDGASVGSISEVEAGAWQLASSSGEDVPLHAGSELDAVSETGSGGALMPQDDGALVSLQASCVQMMMNIVLDLDHRSMTERGGWQRAPKLEAPQTLVFWCFGSLLTLDFWICGTLDFFLIFGENK